MSSAVPAPVQTPAAVLQSAGFVPHPVWTESWVLPGATTVLIPSGLSILPEAVHHATLRAFVLSQVRAGLGVRYATIFAGYATVMGSRVPLLVHVVLAEDVPALLARAEALVQVRAARAAKRAAAAAGSGEVAP